MYNSEVSRRKELENLCHKTLKENQSLLLELLESSKDSDLRTLLVLQAKVIETLLSEREKNAHDTRLIQEFERLATNERRHDKKTQTQNFEKPGLQKSEQCSRRITSRNSSVEKEPDTTIHGVKGHSHEDLRHQHLMNLKGIPQSRKSYTELSHQFSDNEKSNDKYSRTGVRLDYKGLQQMQTQHLNHRIPPSMVEPVKGGSDELLEGSPFNGLLHLKTENLLLFEDYEPSRGMRRSKTEVLFPSQDEDHLAKELRCQNLSNKEEIPSKDKLSHEVMKGSGVEVIQEQQSSPIDEDHESPVSQKSNSEPSESHLSAYISRMKDLKRQTLIPTKDPIGPFKTAGNSPVKPKAGPDTQSKNDLPLKVQTDPHKASVFANLDFKQLLKNKNYQIEVQDGGIDSFLRSVLPSNQREHSPRQSILRLTEPRAPKEARQVKEGRQEKHKMSNYLEKRAKMGKGPPKSASKPSRSSHHQSKGQAKAGLDSSREHNTDNQTDMIKSSLWPSQFNPFIEAEATCDKLSRIKINNYAINLKH
jgi:hypothetical protein